MNRIRLTLMTGIAAYAVVSLAPTVGHAQSKGPHDIDPTAVSAHEGHD